MKALKWSLSLLLLAGVGFGAFFGVRALRDAPGGDGSPGEAEAQAPGPIGPSSEVFEAELSKPRFVGEVLGIFIAPPEVPVPDKYLTFKDICRPDTLTPRVSDERAGQLDLKFQLPPEYIFQPDSMDTGVIVCAPRDQIEILGPESLRLRDPEAGVVYAARWEYAATQPSGHLGRLLIVRSLFPYRQYDVAADRVKATVIGGRPAVLVEPITPDGVSSVAAVIFPEPFGVTEVHSTSVPLADLLAVAEIVAKATQPQ